MRALFECVAIIACLVVAYNATQHLVVFGVMVSVAGTLLADLMRAQILFGRCLTWPLLLARTVFFNANVRVSISYLISIPVDGAQLLVRGSRITTQFQPVGGVYKTTFDETELVSRFKARRDIRFSPDAASKRDLRLVLKGRYVPKLIAWFDSGKDREYLPLREFYEELVVPGTLRREDFLYFDCSYAGRRTFGLKFDEYSQCRQLIIADVYVLRPSPEQEAQLMALKAQCVDDSSGEIYFASADEIIRGGSALGAKATFEVSPTAQWL